MSRIIRSIKDFEEITLGDTFLFYGRPKSGKSTLASQFPEPVVCATEPGWKYIDIEDSRKKRIFMWKEFVSFVNTVVAGGHPYKTVIIDTMDNVGAMGAHELCSQEGKEHISNIGAQGKGWAMWRDMIAYQINRIANLEKYNLILIAHDKRSIVKTRGGEEYDFSTINAGGKLREMLMALPHHILFFDIIEEQEATKRIIRVDNDKHWDAGSRLASISCHKKVYIGESADNVYEHFVNGLIIEKEEE